MKVRVNLHSNPNCTNDTLKDYCENKYGNGDDSSTEYKRAVRDLRRVVDIVMKNKIERPADNDIVGLTETRIHELQFVALAIHASTDAFSHQYIVPYSDTKTILANYKFGNITRVNELIAQRTITLKDFEHLILVKGKHRLAVKNLDFILSIQINKLIERSGIMLAHYMQQRCS